MIIKKYIFVTFFISIFGVEQKAHAMKKIKKNQIKSFNSKFFSTDTSKKICSVREYNYETDEKAIGKITVDHIHALTTVHMMLDIQKSEAYRSDKIEEASRKILNYLRKKSESSNSKHLVYCVDEIPIGFISYSVDDERLIPISRRKRGSIKFLAVDEQSQGMGAGKALMNRAINDCKEADAQSVMLYTTCHAEQKTKNFYEKNGFFDWGSMTNRGDSTWTKSLKEPKTFDPFEWIRIHEEKECCEKDSQDNCCDVNNLANFFNQISII